MFAQLLTRSDENE